MKSNPIIFVVGPTGVGKSGFALEAAKTLNGVILNCDSVQTYRELDIGTAKPSKEERLQVPHFLFDAVGPGEVLTAGDFRRLALPILEAQLPNHPVFAVGGSGFYIQALDKGMFEIEKVDPKKEEELRKQLEARSQKDLYQELEKLDPGSAEELNPNDSYRIQRALIIYHGLGRRLSDLKKEFRPQKLPYPIIKIGFTMERQKLRERIEKRAKQMLEAGLIDEVKSLVEKGFKDWPLLQSVGYKQVLQYLNGELSESELLPEITLRTVQLSKRQMTWFQRDKEIQWFDLGQSGQPQKDALDFLYRVVRTL